MKERLSLTPGRPRYTARRLENPEDKVNAKDHESYRSGVGTVLYLQKKLVWDKANVDNEVNQELDQNKNQREGC